MEFNFGEVAVLRVLNIRHIYIIAEFSIVRNRNISLSNRFEFIMSVCGVWNKNITAKRLKINCDECKSQFHGACVGDIQGWNRKYCFRKTVLVLSTLCIWMKKEYWIWEQCRTLKDIMEVINELKQPNETTTEYNNIMEISESISNSNLQSRFVNWKLTCDELKIYQRKLNV